MAVEVARNPRSTPDERRRLARAIRDDAKRMNDLILERFRTVR